MESNSASPVSPLRFRVPDNLRPRAIHFRRGPSFRGRRMRLDGPTTRPAIEFRHRAKTSKTLVPSLSLSVRIRRWRFHLLTSATCRLAVDLRIIHHRNYQEGGDGFHRGGRGSDGWHGREGEEAKRKAGGEPGQQRIPCSLVSLIIPFTRHAAWFWIEVHTAPARFTSNPFPFPPLSLPAYLALCPASYVASHVSPPPPSSPSWYP